MKRSLDLLLQASLVWAEWAASEVMLNANHRHITMTIPKVLRGYFYKNRLLLKKYLETAAQSGMRVAPKNTAYSAKRGMRGKGKKRKEKEIKELANPTVEQRVFKKRWAQLIHQVFEIDPLICQACGGKMRIISYIEEQEVIEKILKHLKLWEEETPVVRPPPDKSGYSYEPINDGCSPDIE